LPQKFKIKFPQNYENLCSKEHLATDPIYFYGKNKQRSRKA